MRLSMLNERIYAPYKVEMLVEVLEEEGIKAAACLEGSGLKVDEIHLPDTRTSVSQYLIACENALKLAKRKDIAFRVGGRMHLSAYGMYGYALMCSVTIRDFFNLGVKYHRLATPMLPIHWREDGKSAIWYFPETSIAQSSEQLRQFLVEQQFAQHVTHLKDVGGPSCLPTRANFVYAAPSNADQYSRFLGCPCFFEQEQYELLYPASILEQRPQLGHKLTSDTLQQTCDRLIDQTKAGNGIGWEIYQILMRKPGHFPLMEDIAHELNITTRTLRRHLDEEQTTFTKIVDDVKSSLAIEYLKTTRMTIEDIGSLVGFTEPTNFRRAFKRWTGKSPSDYR